MGVRDQCQALTGLPSRKGFPSGSVVKNPPANARDPGIEPMSPALAGTFITTEPPGQPLLLFLSPTITAN